MIDLDNPQVYEWYDPQDMLVHIHNMPELCSQAWQMATNFCLPPDYTHVDKVVVLGMGGSAIGGDLVASLTATEACIPISIHRDYSLPAFVDNKTLVITSSYSGMTEETLSAFKQSLNVDSKKLVITTNGALKELAQKKSIPVFIFNYNSQPRAALPFSFLPILNFLQRMDFISDKSVELTDMVNALEQLSHRIHNTIPITQNRAKQLALGLYGKLAVIYGAGITGEVAHRWKTQINENSKAWAFHEAFPELNHNAVVGYQFPSALASNILVVMLQSNHLPPSILHRYRITSQILNKANVNLDLIEGSGESPLAQMMSLVLFGDYVSYYLAILNKTDPTPIETIDFLKSELGKG
jgi:glucose/mannose-6-phosphate isomerase